MPSKRKAPATSKAPSAKSSKKAKEEGSAAAAETAPAAPPGPASATKGKPFLKMTVADVWSAAAYVDADKMTLSGFDALCSSLSVVEMSFDYLYLMYVLGGSSTGSIEDPQTVCPSKPALQRAFDVLGSRTLGDLSTRLKARCSGLQADYGDGFQLFFRWLFEMGKALAALGSGRSMVGSRTVPLVEGLTLIEAALAQWELMAELKTFCTDKFDQPFTRDLWTQIARFAHMTKTGRIKSDLANYDDDITGGGSAWPSAIDDFVDFVQAVRT